MLTLYRVHLVTKLGRAGERHSDKLVQAESSDVATLRAQEAWVKEWRILGERMSVRTVHVEEVTFGEDGVAL